MQPVQENHDNAPKSITYGAWMVRSAAELLLRSQGDSGSRSRHKTKAFSRLASVKGSRRSNLWFWWLRSHVLAHHPTAATAAVLFSSLLITGSVCILLKRLWKWDPKQAELEMSNFPRACRRSYQKFTMTWVREATYVCRLRAGACRAVSLLDCRLNATAAQAAFLFEYLNFTLYSTLGICESRKFARQLQRSPACPWARVAFSPDPLSLWCKQISRDICLETSQFVFTLF